LKQFQKIVYPGIFYTDLKTFQDLVSMQKESSIYGHVVHKFYSVELNMKRKEKIQVSLCKMEDIGKELSPQYQYHRRMEWFMHFFCDACSNIEWDDHWTIFFIYRELEDQKWECIGMVSTFNFFCLPKNRERLSQFFIFPFAQGYGIGTQTLLFIHRSILADPTVGEFNVEKPGDSFSQMRQVVDTLLCLEKVNLHSLNPSMESPSLDRQKPCFETFLNESFYRLLQSELKITKNQAQHVAIVLSCRSILPKSSSRRVINDEPNVSHEPRGWKQVIYDDILALADSNDLKELRIFVKKRLRRANLEVISQLPAERQRALLNLLWCQSFSKYCRVAYCVERYAQLLVCRKVDHENK
jgi:GNAT superfamily N-acetyltransferase